MESFPKPIYVTQPLLPDIDELKGLLGKIWDSKQISNNGSMAQTLEKELSSFLKAEYLSLFVNGTIALEIACKVLRLSGEVITTPFTFAATCHALALNNIKPVFCDIEEDTFNINPECIEPLITQNTTAIMPVHVFGNPCKVYDIKKIADKYGLKIIYDAAHAFGVKYLGKPISSFGDISMFSFHATKVYNTIEGGALTFNNPYYKERADLLKNFGIRDDNVNEPGTNGKLNEVQAAVGILLLEKVEGEIKRRQELTKLYRHFLKDIPGIKLMNEVEGADYNYPYFVIRVQKDEYGLSRDELFERLKQYNIFAKKYFYPLCSNFSCYRDIKSASKENLPIAQTIADTVLALPLYGALSDIDVEKICSIISAISIISRGKSI